MHSNNIQLLFCKKKRKKRTAYCIHIHFLFWPLFYLSIFIYVTDFRLRRVAVRSRNRLKFIFNLRAVCKIVVLAMQELQPFHEEYIVQSSPCWKNDVVCFGSFESCTVHIIWCTMNHFESDTFHIMWNTLAPLKAVLCIK